jgi:hypothetical protein
MVEVQLAIAVGAYLDVKKDPSAVTDGPRISKSNKLSG